MSSVLIISVVKAIEVKRESTVGSHIYKVKPPRLMIIEAFCFAFLLF